MIIITMIMIMIMIEGAARAGARDDLRGDADGGPRIDIQSTSP